MNIETLRLDIVDYYGEYKNSMHFNDLIKYIERRVDPDKYEELMEAIKENINPKFGHPSIAQVKDAIKEAEKEGITLFKPHLPKQKEMEKIKENQEVAIRLFEQICLEKIPGYKPQFLLDNSYDEYLTYFYEGNNDYMIILSHYFDTMWIMRHGLNMVFPHKPDYTKAMDTAKKVVPQKTIGAARYYLTNYKTPTFFGYCEFLIENAEKRAEVPKVPSIAQVLIREKWEKNSKNDMG